MCECDDDDDGGDDDDASAVNTGQGAWSCQHMESNVISNGADDDVAFLPSLLIVLSHRPSLFVCTKFRFNFLSSSAGSFARSLLLPVFCLSSLNPISRNIVKNTSTHYV